MGHGRRRIMHARRGVTTDAKPCAQAGPQTLECEKLLKFPRGSLPAMDISFTLERGSATSAGFYIRCALLEPVAQAFGTLWAVLNPFWALPSSAALPPTNLPSSQALVSFLVGWNQSKGLAGSRAG